MPIVSDGLTHHAAQRQRLRQGRLDPFGRIRGVPRIAVGQHDAELVAGQSAEDVGVADLVLQALGEDAQELVARLVAQRIVDLLEAVHVDEQHGQRPVLAGADGLVAVGEQQRPVRQAGQLVVEGQPADPVARLFPLHRQGAQVDAGFDQTAVQFDRAGMVVVVEGERADHLAVAGLDRRGPAGMQVRRQERAQRLPTGVDLQIRHQRGFAGVGRMSAGAHVRADLQPFQRLTVGVGQARRGQRPQAPALVHPDHRGQHLRRQPFDLAAQQGGHVGQRRFVRHRVEHPVLQHFVDLGLGDVGEDAHGVGAHAVFVEDRIDRAAAPQRLALAVVEHPVGLDAEPAGEEIGQVVRPAVLAAAPAQQFRGRLGHRLGFGMAEQAAEAGVDVDGQALGVGDDHGIAAAVQPHRQQPHPLLLGALLGDVAEHGQVQAALADAGFGQGEADPAVQAVLADHADVVRIGQQFQHPVALVRIAFGVVAFAHFRRCQHADVLPGQLLPRPAADGHRGRVEPQDAVALVDEQHAVADLLDRVDQQAGGFVQR